MKEEAGRRPGVLVLLLVVTCVILTADIVQARPPCPCSDSSLCNPITTGPRKEVLAFLVSNDNWRKYDWNTITTVAVFASTFDNELLCYAHSRGVRVVLAAFFSASNLNNTSYRNSWIQSTVQSVLDNYADGVNLDFESAVEAGSPQERDLTTLARDLASAVHAKIPGSQVTFDVAWSPNCIDKRCYDYQGLGYFMDFLVIMAYDLMSQIFPPKPCIAGPNSAFPSVVDGINDFIGIGVDPNKLVLGVPWYGHSYTCQHPTNDTVCPITPIPFRGAPCSDAGAPEIDYGILLKMIEENSVSPGRRWNNYFKSPYFDYKDPKTGELHQVWYDDEESLMYKYEFAHLMGLRGIAMWTSDSLDYSNQTQINSMWGGIRKYFLDK